VDAQDLWFAFHDPAQAWRAGETAMRLRGYWLEGRGEAIGCALGFRVMSSAPFMLRLRAQVMP
tara:strand:- start:524 stop:712 length:189 start_codon:yes stop_codon:yes gene_type:complete